MKSLDHPNIPAVYDFDEDSDYTYIIEQYIEGESLGAVLRSRLLSEEELFGWFLEICSIIDYLHNQESEILYLDLKPENLIISGGEVFLIDFGSARSKEFGDTVLCFGSESFCAPEQHTGTHIGREADIFALGKLLKVMLEHSRTGRKNRERLTRIVSACLKEEFHLRIGSAAILIKMIKRIQLKDSKEREKREKKQIHIKRIGVMSLAPSEGATHLSLALSSCLADEFHYRVCYAEMNATGDIAQLCHSGMYREKADGIYEGPGFDIRLRGYGFPGSCTVGDEYDKTVLDLGSDRASALAVMKYCDIRIVVGPAAPWRSAEFEFLKLMRSRNTELKNWFLFVNPASSKLVRRMEETGVPMFAVPYIEDPFDANEEVIKILRKIMK